MSLFVDTIHNVYLTGFTDSTNFPTVNAAQAALGGVQDAFVAKVNSAGSALLYSTYLGGSSADEGFGITVDSQSNAYITGRATSADFPVTARVFQHTYNGTGALGDAFVGLPDRGQIGKREERVGVGPQHGAQGAAFHQIAQVIFPQHFVSESDPSALRRLPVSVVSDPDRDASQVGDERAPQQLKVRDEPRSF